MKRLSRLAGFVLAASVLTGPHAAAEYRHRVVLLEPSDPAADVELRARLRGELEAGGFEVITVALAAGQDPRALAEQTGGTLHPAAVLYIVEAAPGAPSESSELWLSDRLLRRTFVLRFAPHPENSEEASRVAVQAAEILKADLAELSVTEAATPAPPPREVARPALAEKRRERRPWRVLFEPGAALMAGFSGLNPSVSPILRAGASLPATWEGSEPPIWELYGKVAAFGSDARLETSAGSARVAQSLAGAELALRLLPASSIQPLLIVSGDAYVVGVQGESTAPAHSRTTVSFASGGGAGLCFAPFRRELPTLAIALRGLLEVAWAPTEIRIAGEKVATAGAPLGLFSASAVGVF
jgi:hypothetical protein